MDESVGNGVVLGKSPMLRRGGCRDQLQKGSNLGNLDRGLFLMQA